MDFQRYYDGVGLIVENKINNSFSTCPLCGEMRVDWEIVFDFKGELICVLAKCPHCGGVIKTIFNFNNGENPTSFTVSDTGGTNRNSLVQGVLHVAFKRAQCSKRRFRRIVNASPIGKGRRDGRLGHSRIFPSYRRLHFVACLERRTSRKVTERRHRLSCFRMFGSCGKYIISHNPFCDFGVWFGSVCGNSSDSINVDIRQIYDVCAYVR